MLTNSTGYPPYSLIYHYSPIDLQKKDQYPRIFPEIHINEIWWEVKVKLWYSISQKKKKKKKIKKKIQNIYIFSWSERIELVDQFLQVRSILDKKLKIFVFIFFNSNFFKCFPLYYFLFLLGRSFPTMLNLLSFLKYSKSCGLKN